MYLGTSNRNYWVLDIESDSLTPSIIWCVCLKNVATDEEITLLTREEILAFFTSHKDDLFIGHNIVKFDVPNLNKIVGTRIPIGNLIDTMILSMLFNPSLAGGHSLESWGERLKIPKGNFSDFSKLSEEMIQYCLRDVMLTCEVFKRLATRLRKIGFSDEGLELEHKAWWLTKKQHDNGFSFNIAEAHVLYSKLRQIENDLKDKIYEFWPPQLIEVAKFAKAFKKDGTHGATCVGHAAKFPKLVIHDDGTYSAFDWVEFSIGSPKQRVDKLLELGWVPKEFTKPSKTNPLGSPKPTDKGELSPSLVEFVEESGKQEVRLIAKWITINSRANMINTWMEAYNDKTGAIHGTLWLANTRRYRHSNPNTANIPAVRLDGDNNPIKGADGDFTYEARDLWTTRDSVHRTLCGVDAKGIQLRVLANYLDNDQFTKAVLNGDPHSFNQTIGGFRTRAVAKTFIYAFLLGAGDAKIGQIVGGSPTEGKRTKRKFIGDFGGLDGLLSDLKEQVERTGRIILCDGVSVLCDKMHTRLGYLLQGDESCIMKKAKILVDAQVRREKLDVFFVGDIHDEWQVDVLTEHADRFIEICKQCFKEAGEFFNYNIPIDCDAKKGKTWAQTH